jgi:crossover junction endodeoxyribonuclease RusA
MAGPPLFEVCVHGQAFSAQSGNRTRLDAWKRRVFTISVAAWTAKPPLSGPVELHIFHYTEETTADLDNLNKPIQDALQGVVFFDDRQVRLSRSGWRDINGAYRLRYISPTLGSAFSDGRPFVHIRAWRAPVTEELS